MLKAVDLFIGSERAGQVLASSLQILAVEILW